MRVWIAYFRYTPEILALIATCIVLAQ